MSTVRERKKGQEKTPGRPPLIRRVHKDFCELYIPFYDEELDLPADKPHTFVVRDFGNALARVAALAGFELLSDNPIWYWDFREEKQKVFFGDFAFSRNFDGSDTADDILLVFEIVSTSNRQKLEKDTVFQKALNEKNGVPEFGLYFPDTEDARSLVWYHMVDGRYQEIPLVSNRYESRSIPGLVIEVLPRSQWTRDRKVLVYYNGQPMLSSGEEYEIRRVESTRSAREIEQARHRAEQAAQRAEQAAQQAEQALQQAEEARRQAEEERSQRLELERRLAELEGKKTDPK